jgi:competence protein ComEC
MPAGPILCAAILVAACVGVETDMPGEPVAAAALAAASLALLAPRGATRVWLVGLACLCGVAANAAVARERALAPPLTAWFEALAGSGERLEETVTIDGRLQDDGAADEGGIQTRVAVARVRDASGWHRAPGRVQLHITGALGQAAVDTWRAGRRVEVPVTIRRPRMLLNPGGATPRLQALRRPFDLSATAKSAALAVVERGAWWDEAAAALRAHVRRALWRSVAPEGLASAGARSAAVATAILIGDRAGLSDDLERRLQAAGTYHVVAISGGNIALVAAMAFALCSLLTRGARARSGGTMAVVVAYGWVVGGDPSVTRAVAAACLYLTVGLAGLSPRPLHVLAAVAAGVVIADPLTVIDVGAWLSFGATFGIVLGVAPLTAKVLANRHTRATRFVRPFVTLFAASVAAEIVLLPIAAMVFGRVSVAGLVLNLVAIPAMAVLQASGLAVAALSMLWPSGAAAAAAVTVVSGEVLIGSSGLVDAAPWLAWRVPPPSVIWIALYYLACLAALGAPPIAMRRLAVFAAALLAGIIVTSPGLGRSGPRGGLLRVTVLDVGQGDALFLQLPSGRALLVDAGGGPGSFDIGGRVVTPAVWALGSRRLEWLALTHGDLDHTGGALSVLADLQPREVWEGIPVPRDPALQEIRGAARAGGASWRTLRPGNLLEAGGVTIEVCHPPAPDWERQRVRNDDSVVLRVRYGDVELLLTGDAGPEFERAWPAEGAAAPIRILKAGHHGSRTSSSAAFLEVYRPQAILISVGRGNLFGHPAPAVLARFGAIGADVFRTDEDGALIVETDGVQARVRTWRGRTWTIGTLRLSS